MKEMVQVDTVNITSERINCYGMPKLHSNERQLIAVLNIDLIHNLSPNSNFLFRGIWLVTDLKR